MSIDKSDIVLTPAKAAEMIGRELGLSARAVYNGNALAAIADPMKAFGEYNASLDDVTKEAANTMIADMGRLNKLGLPSDVVQAVALKKAAMMMESEKSILDMQHPLVRDIDLMGTLIAKSGGPIQIPKPFGGEASAAKYAKYRAAYKAKKAKRGKKAAK